MSYPRRILQTRLDGVEYSIDCFPILEMSGKYAYLITDWESSNSRKLSPTVLKTIQDDLLKKTEQPVCLISHQHRPYKKTAEDLQTLYLDPALKTQEFYTTSELGATYQVCFEKVKQVGLFLDHFDLRVWLSQHSNASSVLNLFSFTGSLSVISALSSKKKRGGEEPQVISVDISKPIQAWARKNWELNQLSSDALFYDWDVFEALKRFQKQKKSFDLILCDPPSFSRTKSSQFSTKSDLKKLHEMSFELLSPQGIFVSSVNSATLSREEFVSTLISAAGSVGKKFTVLKELGLSQDFPTELDKNFKAFEEHRYLKGLILKAQ